MSKEQDWQNLVEKFKAEATVDSKNHDIRTGNSRASITATKEKYPYGLCHRWEILSYGLCQEFWHAVDKPDQVIIDRLAKMEADHAIPYGIRREDRAQTWAAHKAALLRAA